MAKLTWDDVEEKLENLGFKVSNWQSNGNSYSCEIQKYSPAGQDCNFILQCEKDNPASVSKAFKELYENYDPEEETMLWVDESGHGKNGAPYHLSDVLKDMESVERDLEVAKNKMTDFVQNFDFEYTKDEMKNEFLDQVIQINGTFNIEVKHAISLCKQAADYIINEEHGSPKEKKELLNDVLKEIGVSDNKPETYAASMNKAIAEYQKQIEKMEMKEACKKHTFSTVKPMMSSTEVCVHRMFDRLFNESEINPVEYAKFVLDASGGALLHGKKGDRFWEEAVEHAVNSGGELWQSSAERVELMEKAGLIANNYEDSFLIAACYNAYKSYMKVYGTPGDTVTFGEFVSDIFPNKNDMTEYLQADKKLLNKYKNFDEDKTNALIDKYIDKADKMWGKYMHSYLKDLDVLDNKARDRKIADYEKKHDVSHGR